jgi:acyl-CoA synthetase (NDP forming)
LPVNRRAEIVQGENAYPTPRDVPRPIDVARVLINTLGVEVAIHDCATRHVPVVRVLAGGFAETVPERVSIYLCSW